VPSIEQNNWHVRYFWSESSGLKLGNCDFGSRRAIHNASVPFVYVNYAGDEFGPFTDELQSESTHVEVREIMHGFDLRVTYDAYGADYQYQHVWRFHSDGQFGASIVIHGPGEELDGQHVYHVPFRLDLDLSGAGGDRLQRRVAAGWKDVLREGRIPAATGPTSDYDWRIIDRQARKNAFIRAGTGDDGELWALRYKRVESWSAWGAAGAGVPGTPGSVPAVYDDGESIDGANIVLWYIAHIPARDRIAACGPWLRLDGYPASKEPPDHNHDHDHDDDHDHDHGDDH
jgi:hypothetical protein